MRAAAAVGRACLRESVTVSSYFASLHNGYMTGPNDPLCCWAGADHFPGATPLSRLFVLGGGGSPTWEREYCT